MDTTTDVTNAKRAAWANAALYLFCQLTGSDQEDALGDLLCDLMHWAVRDGFDFDLALSRAKGHFDEERDEEERDWLLAAAPDLAEALHAIKRLARQHDASGYDPYRVLELIERKATDALAQPKGGSQ